MKAMAMAGVGDNGNSALRLEDVAKQFKQWRQSRVRGERIPAALWGEATRLCQEHAPQRVAGVLRVALAGLMQRVVRADDGAAQRPELDTEFVEVIMSSPSALRPDTAASRLDLAPTTEAPSGAARPTPTPVRAYHVYVQLGCIAQGLLQHLAINHTSEVWHCFRSWLRTMNPAMPPSELIVASALRTTLTGLLTVPALAPDLTKIMAKYHRHDPPYEVERMAA